MFSFSKLHEKLHVLSRSPRSKLSDAITEVSGFGKHMVIDGEDCRGSLKQIIKYMRKYGDSLKLQQVACHAISNLSMQEHAARFICHNDGFDLIKKAALTFIENAKLCWVASSALWNLARVPENRLIIGAEGVELLTIILLKHSIKERVANTAIGALSNLSLCDTLRDQIANDTSAVFSIMSVLKHYQNKGAYNVTTSGAGLIANLAVSDRLGGELINSGIVPLLLQLLQHNHNNNNNNNNSSDAENNNDINDNIDTLYRNACAALNNLCTAKPFLNSFLRCYGIETLYTFLENHNTTLFNSLLDHCFVVSKATRNTKTTSFHLCALHGETTILKELIDENHKFNIDEVDGHNKTCLDYSIEHEKYYTIRFLSKIGAVKYTQKKENMTYKIKAALDDGKVILHQTNTTYKYTIENTLSSFPIEMCHLPLEFVSNIDQLKGLSIFC